MIYDSLANRRDGGKFFCRKMSSKSGQTIVEWVGEDGLRCLKAFPSDRVTPTPGLIESGWTNVTFEPPASFNSTSDSLLTPSKDLALPSVSKITYGLYGYLVIAIFWRLIRSYLVSYFFDSKDMYSFNIFSITYF